MKTLFTLGLFLSTLSPLAYAEAPSFSCKIMIPLDPVNNPNAFTETISTVTVAPDKQTHYVLLNKEVKAAEEISKEAYFQYKADKYRGIGGQYVVAYLAEGDGEVALTFGKTDLLSGSLQGGATFFAQNAPFALMLPTGAGSGASCALPK